MMAGIPNHGSWKFQQILVIPPKQHKLRRKATFITDKESSTMYVAYECAQIFIGTAPVCPISSDKKAGIMLNWSSYMAEYQPSNRRS